VVNKQQKFRNASNSLQIVELYRALPMTRILLGAIVIGAITLAIYFPSLKGSFILDDNLLLTDNVLIKAPNGLSRFWLSTEATDYWPVTLLFVLDRVALVGNEPCRVSRYKSLLTRC
jgi:hypothetical protein